MGRNLFWFGMAGTALLGNAAPMQIYAGAAIYNPDPNIVLRGKPRSPNEHDEIYGKAKFPYVFNIKRGAGQLTFVGTQHLYDPADPQLKVIEELWHKTKPEVALVESRVTAYSGKPEDAAKRGEPYYVLVLARKSGVEIFSLEPDAKVEGAALAKAESPERALLYKTLQGYFSRRRSESNTPDAIIQFMLSRRAKEYGLECNLKTIADMDALWKKDFPNSEDWRKIDERATWPGKVNTYLNHLSNVGNAVRDEHWAKVMVDLVQKGKNVFAVGGASHTINLEPVLRETLRQD